MNQQEEKEEYVIIRKADLISAWTILENIACSLDQIGGAYDYMDEDGQIVNEQEHQAVCKALDDYFSPELFYKINEARMRLGSYIPDKEAEYLSEHLIPYWNYKSEKKLQVRQVDEDEGMKIRKGKED